MGGWGRQGEPVGPLESDPLWRNIVALIEEIVGDELNGPVTGLAPSRLYQTPQPHPNSWWEYRFSFGQLPAPLHRRCLAQHEACGR